MVHWAREWLGLTEVKRVLRVILPESASTKQAWLRIREIVDRDIFYSILTPCLRQRGHGQEMGEGCELYYHPAPPQPRQPTRRPRDVQPRTCKLGARYVETITCPSSSLSVHHRPSLGHSHSRPHWAKGKNSTFPGGHTKHRPLRAPGT
ncbi:hypothetical protein AVEN_165437-1 [Araneus ventricosus]|uniref:Uncharacterized protein n=1 Tax=Araneus ventricosus TaxID=182803 RepID=A0A4Y2AWJ4_ARAVE|nr:hypothetical protein AVEN_165437-1 [Araneus ventricosus]